MRRNRIALAVLALVVIAAALASAVAGKNDLTSTERPAPARDRQQAATPAPTESGSQDPVTDVARRYALAARNWTPSSYRASWEVQIGLADGRYRRELISARPDADQLGALEQDRATSRARVVRAQRDPAVRPPAARVFVILHETTVAGGQAARGLTINEVRLASRRGRWMVIGWTVVPGG